MKTIIEYARGDVGVRESAGRNRSPRIDTYNLFVGNQLGDPYCAAAVSYWGACAAGSNFLRSGSSQEFRRWAARLGRLSFNAQDLNSWKGGLIGFTLEDDPDHGHVGLAEKRLTTDGVILKLQTIEANTGPAGAVEAQGGRDGEGVFQKIRTPSNDSSFKSGLQWWYVNLTGIRGCEYWA